MGWEWDGTRCPLAPTLSPSSKANFVCLDGEGWGWLGVVIDIHNSKP